ncbi:MarR family winged helix-turn-helix transcriptional regulator [Brevibacterium ravenspurgense]|uniref:MarR family winged helix-turn-helix transcriptional regulator n=1 Tax=Brevibacterium ravenspurgense TaxID=479117 RepID=UPI001EF1D8E7|nr:MarR family winged helix-turn-helix transcriptional regulator [Brevibacterium ravenspurgense]MCG7300557.1 MarR family winged helix-turn-helix transcriptional regulator [Brevibacterium ravenspurgense]
MTSAQTSPNGDKRNPALNEEDRRYHGGLDYWKFTEHARSRLASKAPGADAAATSLIISLVRAATTFTSAMESKIHRPSGKSWAAYQLLYTLWIAGDMYPSEAATLTRMSRAAISGITSRLGGAGLIEKVPAPEDGRSTLLKLTPAGVDEARRLHALQNVHESEWADALTPEEQQILLLLLQKLLAGPGPVDSLK